MDFPSPTNFRNEKKFEHIPQHARVCPRIVAGRNTTRATGVRREKATPKQVNAGMSLS